MRASKLEKKLIDIGFVKNEHMGSNHEVYLSYKDNVEVFINKNGYVEVYVGNYYSGILSIFSDEAIDLIVDEIKKRC